MFKLVISDDEGKTIIVPLIREQITVGRQDGNTIRLTERNVSRQHARLVKGEQAYRVEDLESYNGVTVNGTRVVKQAELKDGDRVGIGDYIIAIKADPDSASLLAPAPAPARASAPPGQGPTPARLVMISAPAPGAEFSIAKPTVRIGRLEELDLCISHRSISREHARISTQDGAFELEDLNSANGIRVNGTATKKGALKSGDIVELGQVRFRFVGAGEAYVYDPSEEEPAPLAEEPAGPPKRTIVWIAVAAALVGGVLAVMDGGAKKRPAETPPPPAPSVQAPEPDLRGQLSAALEGCKRGLAAEQYEEAARAAQGGLSLDSADGALSDCKREADQGLQAAANFEQGKGALAQGKLEEAQQLFAGLPEAYQSREEVVQVNQRLALAKLTEARTQLRTHPEEAHRIAEQVLGLRGLTTVMTEDAERLKAAASKNMGAGPSATPEAASPGVDPARRAKPVEGPGASPSEGAESPSQVARDCLARGDQRCAVRALEGHAESAQELALLIETYRALGETKKAVKHMESFVARFPTARQATQYRQFVAKYE